MFLQVWGVRFFTGGQKVQTQDGLVGRLSLPLAYAVPQWCKYNVNQEKVADCRLRQRCQMKSQHCHNLHASQAVHGADDISTTNF